MSGLTTAKVMIEGDETSAKFARRPYKITGPPSIDSCKSLLAIDGNNGEWLAV